MTPDQLTELLAAARDLRSTPSLADKNEMILRLAAEVERLAAERDALRKAGDELARATDNLANIANLNIADAALAAWREATKEAK